MGVEFRTLTDIKRFVVRLQLLMQCWAESKHFPKSTKALLQVVDPFSSCGFLGILIL